LELGRLQDERGFFARSFCQEEFRQHGLNPQIAQCNVSWNRARGTLRGLHFQALPHEEAKVVRCTQGAIWDVIVDMREGSSTRWRWHAVELTAAYLHQRVVDTLAARRAIKASPIQKQQLAAVIHLCGLKRGETFAARGFRAAPGELCGTHSLQRYLTKIELMKKRFARLAENNRG